MSKDPTRPIEIVVCQECGEPAMPWAPVWGDLCANGGRHGPTQRVPVVPVESVRPLWEAAIANWDAEDLGELDCSSIAYPGASIKGKDLYQIGVELGFIDSVDSDA